MFNLKKKKESLPENFQELAQRIKDLEGENKSLKEEIKRLEKGQVIDKAIIIIISHFREAERVATRETKKYVFDYQQLCDLIDDVEAIK